MAAGSYTTPWGTIQHLDALFGMIAEGSPLAARFIIRIRARCERLETFPLAGAQAPYLEAVCALYLNGPT